MTQNCKSSAIIAQYRGNIRNFVYEWQNFGKLTRSYNHSFVFPSFLTLEYKSLRRTCYEEICRSLRKVVAKKGQKCTPRQS